MRELLFRHLGVALLAVSALAGCSSASTTGPEDPEGIRVIGWIERNSVVTLEVDDRELAGAGKIDWSASPESAVEFIGDGRARLLTVGNVTLTARAGDKELTREIEIAPPPVLVFEMLRNGVRDIYRVDLDGENLIRLTGANADNREPTVAGDKVVYVTYRHGNGELYSVPLAGGAETRLTQTAPHESEPALSRDGKRLAFTSTASGVPKLWVASGDATGMSRAAAGFGFAGSIEAGPSWAPNGDRLVFVSTTKGTADLFIYNAANGSVTSLLESPAPEVEPAWSKDGKWVAFASARDGQTDIYRIHISTGEIQQLTNRADTDARPTWLADGRLAYIARVDGQTRLRWLDPENPETSHEVPILDPGTIGKVAALW